MDTLRIKLLSPHAKAPEKGSADAAGYDVFACFSAKPDYRMEVYPGARAKIPLGFAAAWDGPYYGRIAPRSGLAVKNGIQLMGGVVDKDYRGEWAAIIHNSSEQTFVVRHGDKIAQVVFEAYKSWGEVKIYDSLDETDRGSNGFGSTGG